MCLIIDANVIAIVLEPEPREDYLPVRKALDQKRAVMVYGGKLAEEYLAVRRIMGMLKEFDRKGIARKISDEKVNKATEQVKRDGYCISNDHHIIALSLVSNVRLLCSEDSDLNTDFTNPSVLKPAGSVYRRKSHAHLIRKYCCQPSKRLKKHDRSRKKK